MPYGTMLPASLLTFLAASGAGSGADPRRILEAAVDD